MAGSRQRRKDEDGNLPDRTWQRRAESRLKARDNQLALENDPVQRVAIAMDTLRGVIRKALRHQPSIATAYAADAERLVLELTDNCLKALDAERRTNR